MKTNTGKKVYCKGKMVYCEETQQIFPSLKAAAEYHNIGYHSVAKNAEDKAKVACGKHFVFVESFADISKIFADERKMEKERVAMRKAAEEKLAELTATQKGIAKDIAKTRRLIKKYM
jgi:hypothetical protein